ncbi:uncharacterized protein PFLUO_LOCUS8040 [Penicillium psychrofluorescens]|uniref:uncharacterized protein n=1 Tax=Penicillium psychrofluorescens TaxID=3158075 RepID=UPI003CCDF2AA
MLGPEMFTAVTQHTQSRSSRISSWDHSGLNEDAFVVQPGETAILADIEGPGVITHLWFVQACRRILGPGLIPYSKSGVAMQEVENGQGVNYEVMDPDYYRKVLIRMYWDDSETPNVLAPLGDFFCVGHSIASNFQSLPFTASVKPSEDKKFGGAAALNCYLPMPFNKRARIEVENQNDIAYFQYFYIDYELRAEPHPENTLFFHAHWRRQNPTPGWAPPDLQTNSLETMVPNLDGKQNYVILETTGAGAYVGCNHSVYHFQGTWWGEGDDMIFIDDDTWPPSMHGTGAEDYFSQGWGMQKNAFPFAGSIIHEGEMPPYQVSYRWHLPDPVKFNTRIKVTMDWYQTLPGPKLDILPVSERLPRRTEIIPPVSDEKPELDERRTKMVQQRQERLDAFVADKLKWLERRAQDSRQRAAKNKEDAADVRRRFLEAIKK